MFADASKKSLLVRFKSLFPDMVSEIAHAVPKDFLLKADSFRGSDAAAFSSMVLKVWQKDFNKRGKAHVERSGGVAGGPCVVAFTGKRHYATLFSPPLKKVESYGLQSLRPPDWPFGPRSEIWVCFCLHSISSPFLKKVVIYDLDDSKVCATSGDNFLSEQVTFFLEAVSDICCACFFAWIIVTRLLWTCLTQKDLLQCRAGHFE